MPRTYETLNPEIIISAQNGSIDDFEIIVYHYEKPVFNFIYRMVGNSIDSADLTQETFIKLYLNLHRYNTEKKFSTWLFTIVQRTVFDWLRKKKRNMELLIIDDPKKFVEPAEMKREEGFASRIDVNEAFSHLKDNYKSVLMLYYWQGYNHKEIAEILHRPMNTVKTLMRRAKQALKNEIGIY